jgi:small subunit ribosomal protein S11
MANKKIDKKAKTSAKKTFEKGKVYISASFNNTLITVTDMEGNTIAWGSSGRSGFKGTRKSTPYAATTAVDSVIRKEYEDY